MSSSFPIRSIEMTGRYLVLLPEGQASSGMAALTDSTGVRNIDDSAVSNLGVAVVTLDPDNLQSLSAAVAGDAPLLAVEPEQILYAIEGSSISSDTVNYLQGYKDGVSNLTNSLGSNGSATKANGQLTTAVFYDGSTTWGLQATKVTSNRYSGAGIKVAVLDTGFDLTHPDFVGRAITTKSFISGEDVQDLQGHGTHCIGTSCGVLNPADLSFPRRYGIAYQAEIFVGKVLSNAGSGSDGGILAGIDWAVSNGCHIVSMSLGAPARPGETYSTIYETIAQRALSRGTLIIAAAGNESYRPGNVKPVGRPANCPSIMAVAAVDKQLQTAFFSTSSINPNGGQIDITGPGVDVYSTWSTKAYPPSRYNTISGTSMATPHVAGIAALHAEATGKRGLELWALLMQNAQRLPLPSVDVGVGLVQAP
jgi:subtilisin